MSSAEGLRLSIALRTSFIASSSPVTMYPSPSRTSGDIFPSGSSNSRRADAHKLAQIRQSLIVEVRRQKLSLAFGERHKLEQPFY